MKGKGGIIGLTVNPAALQRWLICGPELARCISEFESEIEHASYSSSQLHHEEGLTAQTNFKQQVNSLVDVISTFGNPFEDGCPELVVLNTRACANDSVAETVKRVKDLGREQYLKYKNEVLINRTGSIHDTIKRNSLALFRSPEPKLKSKTSQQLAAYRSNTSLFGRLYIANQQRNADPAEFFSHENQPTPPSLSDFGTIRIGKKSVLLSCFDTTHQPSQLSQFDCKILDGAAVVHFLKSETAVTFADYSNKIFIPYILQQFQDTSRIDLVWDCCLTKSIKGGARNKRGSGIRVKVSAQAKIPKRWENFLRDSRNKEEIFSFLTECLSSIQVPDGKVVFITSGKHELKYIMHDNIIIAIIFRYQGQM